MHNILFKGIEWGIEFASCAYVLCSSHSTTTESIIQHNGYLECVFINTKMLMSDFSYQLDLVMF